MQLMKKISILLILVMLVSLLGSCVSNKTTTGDEPNVDATITVATSGGNSSTEPAESSEPGQELSGFIQTYLDAKGPLYDKLSAASENDPKLMTAWISIMTTDMVIAFVPLFDFVDADGGILIQTEIDNAFKKFNGNTIDFGYDYLTKEGNSSGFPAGSHSTFVGKFNVDKNCLTLEKIDDKGTDGITRTVVEITRNAADSYTSQYITSNASELTAYFTFFKGETLLSYTATRDQGIDFTYHSIYEKSNPTIDDMNADFTLKSVIKFVGGTATYETMTE